MLQLYPAKLPSSDEQGDGDGGLDRVYVLTHSYGHQCHSFFSCLTATATNATPSAPSAPVRTFAAPGVVSVTAIEGGSVWSVVLTNIYIEYVIIYFAPRCHVFMFSYVFMLAQTLFFFSRVRVFGVFGVL